MPQLTREQLDQLLDQQDDEALFEVLAEPLHAALYSRQSFELLQELSPGQQLILMFDYLRQQAGQGGFIQFIQNGYVSMLLPLHQNLERLGDTDMARLLDDVLKVYVLNREMLDQDTTVEEFALLYRELQEFEALDARFRELEPLSLYRIMTYVKGHPQDFIAILPES